MHLPTSLSSLTGAMLVSLVLSPSAPGADVAQVASKPIADFALNDFLGAERSLAEWRDKPVVVVVFLGTECPLAKLYGKRLAELDREFADQGVQIIGVNANRQDTLQEMAGYAKKHGIEFPLLKDSGGAVADQFGATRTPEAYVLDAQRVVRYHGRIDDQYGVGAVRKKASQTELVDAIKALLRGKPVAVAETKAVGCIIGRREPNQAASDVTYTRHIVPLLQQRCVECHRDGQIAPFTLTEYADVVAWSDMCREVIDEGRMPPWQADPAHGEFLNDARLSETEKDLFRRWVDAGVPQGNPADLPPPREFADDWRIPTPDVVYEMPEEFDVPATGTVDYQHFYIDPGFTEDKWVYGADARPGNHEVVHHLILFYVPPGQRRHRPQDALINAIAAYAPGMPAVVGPEQFAVRIPAGSKLVFQVHYTPNGSPQKDRSQAALKFADPAKVAKQVRVQAGINPKFLIPPLVSDYPLYAEREIKRDSWLYTLTPHMHYRGKSFKFTAKYPDGSEEILLNVPRYDFNWQFIYLLKEPKRLPAGTVVHLEAHYDNSYNNPLNPDPLQFLHWGDQTWDEMMLGSLTTSLADQDLRVGPPHVEAVLDADGKESGDYRVRFRYRPPEGDVDQPAELKAVHLAGTFNDWNAVDQRLEGPNSEGFYTIELTLPAGSYEYKFVLNGEKWKADPGVFEVTRDEGNSVLEVPAPTPTTKIAGRSRRDR